MEPPYCLMYPICFFNDMLKDLKNQLHTDLFPPGLCCQECVCCRLIQWANLHEKWETIMASSCFLLPHGAQYNDNLLPWLIRPWNHRSLLVDLMPAPQGGVCHQHQVSKSPSREIKNSSGPRNQLSPLSGTEAHPSEASPQLPNHRCQRCHTELGTSGGTLHTHLQMQAPQPRPCTRLLPALWGRGCGQVASSSHHPGDPAQALRGC